ncbi:MAG: AAA family ATPase [Syntrophobacteraceae bacterium]|jgi:hypothetical protein|nr:AAA family ATPase [Syntrophobacteraceae bacterium]MCU0588904.1 AAA family ATPase [Syntrophobacteraceae bacterium]
MVNDVSPDDLAKIQMIERTLGSPLPLGKLGVLMARTGVGKTGCLTHIALQEILKGAKVLHVCIEDPPDKVKAWYHELFKHIFVGKSAEELTELQYRIEPCRFILAFLNKSFHPGKLEQSIGNLRDQAGFAPSLVIVDGIDFDSEAGGTVEALADLAERHGVAMWLSARTHSHIPTVNSRGIPYPCDTLDHWFHSILLLEPTPSFVRVKVLKNSDALLPEHAPVSLDLQTLLITQA